MKPERRWRRTVQTGLLWGAGAVFLSLVGLIEALQQRQIITGVISGGHTLLLVVALAAGLSADRQHAGDGAVSEFASAGLARAVAGVLVGALGGRGAGADP